MHYGWASYLSVLAFISLSLALLNLLPLLPLDGGHIAFSLLEGIRGRAIAREVYERVSAVGIALVLCSSSSASRTTSAGSAAAKGSRQRLHDLATSCYKDRSGVAVKLETAWRASGRSRSAASQIGGGAPVVVQSMTLTKTHDVEATTAQIAALASAGCEIVRVAVPKTEDADALPLIVRLSPIPVIADIHFNASLALRAIDARRRGRPDQPRATSAGPTRSSWSSRRRRRQASRCGSAPTPARCPKHLAAVAQKDQAEALVAAAIEEVELLEKLDFHDFKISVKSSHVPTMIRAYRMLSEKVPYPLHLGVTEAGTPFSGSIKSAVGMGALLVDGIGDTMRVSLTADPVKEVETAWEILKALGLRERGPIMIACPSCGRDNVGVENLAVVVEERLQAPIRSTSRSPCSAARSTGRARRATPTSASPAAATSASSTRTAACSRRSPRTS